MKICIYGAGAIGGYLGVQLARAGVDVSLVARGAHLAAMKANGLKLRIGDEERVLQIGRLLIENAIRHTPPETRIAVRAGSDGIAARLPSAAQPGSTRGPGFDACPRKSKCVTGGCGDGSRRK